jgi:hypothetical protein
VFAAGSILSRFEVDRQTEVSPQPQSHRGKNQLQLKALLPDIEARLPRAIDWPIGSRGEIGIQRHLFCPAESLQKFVMPVGMPIRNHVDDD